MTGFAGAIRRMAPAISLDFVPNSPVLLLNDELGGDEVLEREAD
jgi:hypothetical protein